MTFREWLDIRAYDINDGDTIDIFSQLFACLDNTGAAYLNASDISITDDGELVYSVSDSFDDTYRPVKPAGDASDAVFAAGIMLYHKVSGELPDMDNAGLLLLGAQSDDSISLCSYPASSADALISDMTRICVQKRPSFRQALDALASLNTSKARILFREEQTGIILCEREIPITDGYTE
ncbi:MAG: hypothetical protein ILP19_02685 [Oscillospiraceae bacterium]|nr:hypothetical protein [Oscillospiraceae bacterium]